MLSLAVLCCWQSAAQAKPSLSLRINGVTPLPGDLLAAAPVISVTVVSSAAAVTGRITIDDTATALIFVGSSGHFYATLEVTPPLADGRHGLTIEAFDTTGGATYELVPLFVEGGPELTVIGSPLNYPNPFDPGSAGAATTIAYSLSKAADLTLSLHDLYGRLVAKMSFNAGANGGRAGYNTVSWNGRSDAGQVVGNGLYIYLLAADGRVVGRGKLMVLKR